MLRNAARQLSQRLTGEKHPSVAVRRLRRQLDARLHTRTYGLDELRAALRRAGVRAGRTVFLQSSWDEFYRFQGEPRQVLDLILEELGPHGTLVSPATPLIKEATAVLDFRRAPSVAGLLTELLRRYPGVERSVHRTSSVCALGPAARDLVRDHHLTETPWDEDSPYYRLRDLDSVTLALGLYNFHATPLHCTECVLRREIPYFADLFQNTVTYRWRDTRGAVGTHTYLSRRGRFQLRAYAPFFSGYEDFRLSNLHVFSMDVRPMLDRALALGRRGITMYYDPLPLPWRMRPFAPGGA